MPLGRNTKIQKYENTKVQKYKIQKYKNTNVDFFPRFNSFWLINPSDDL